jgi:hypothetical protein
MTGIVGAAGAAGATALINSIFGGGNKADPQYGYGYTGGTSFTQGGGSSQNQSRSWQNPDTVWGVQSPYLGDLYSRAQAGVQNFGGVTQEAYGAVNQGYSALESLMNPGVNPMMEVYQQQMQQGLEQNILPTIQREAIGRGMVGGTRQGVAEGLVGQQALREQSQFAAKLYGEDRDRMLGAAGMVPGLTQAGLGVPWYGLNQYAGILGSPTVLGGGGGSISSGSSKQYNVGGSENFGENFYGPNADNPYVPGGVAPPATEESPGFQDQNDRFGNN